ncbi:MAG: hypothetical protein IJD90_02170, partial [Clostridia bacterium]|nr:hypothetical protein [Clostridia bacterium]
NYEIDIYPFCKNQATMEIELEDENIEPKLLEQIEILADVTYETGYSNFELSIKIPDELI